MTWKQSDFEKDKWVSHGDLHQHCAMHVVWWKWSMSVLSNMVPQATRGYWALKLSVAGATEELDF